MGRACPNCKKGMMTLKGGKHNRKWRCPSCGHWIFTSPAGHSRGYMLGTQTVETHPDPKVEEASQRLQEETDHPHFRTRERPKKKEEIPKIEEEKPKMTEDERIMREEQIRYMRKQESIRKMLKEMGRGKYSPFKGKEVYIEGEKYIVE